MRTPRLAAAAAFACAAAGAHAADLNALQLLNQSEFRKLSEDVAAAVSYKPMIPSEPLNLVGFDIGVSATATELRNRDVYIKAASGSDIPNAVPQVALRAHKGLPFGIDIGAAVATLPGTNVRSLGGELRWAFIEGGTVTPSVAARLGVSSMSGVDQMDLRTTSVDLSISKGFLNFTPYAGIGRVQAKATPNGVATLKSESFGMTKVFVGANINVLVMDLVIEADKTGDASSLGVKLGYRF